MTMIVTGASLACRTVYRALYVSTLDRTYEECRASAKRARTFENEPRNLDPCNRSLATTEHAASVLLAGKLWLNIHYITGPAWSCYIPPDRTGLSPLGQQLVHSELP